jgi:ADP-ribosyl-[dinitrogen reductase] hydrolase
VELTTEQQDRAAGVLLGQACGDALGVPYEFATPPGPHELAEMRGGGLGNFARGEWSDDTAMAVAVAEVAATGADLTHPDALDAVAAGFVRWYDDGPADIGLQTRAVLEATSRRWRPGAAGAGRIAAEEAATYAAGHAHAAGNGALMRTGVVALAHLDDRERCAAAAQAVASLTHVDPLARESCVLWCEAVRVAVLHGHLDLRTGLDLLPPARRDPWAHWLDEAHQRPPATFTPNGFTVTALQAATAAIVQTGPQGPEHLQAALHAAVRIGDDTDTVAAIAGGLLGARWGASAVPATWRRAVHGWPGRTADDLVALGAASASGDSTDEA